MARRERRVRRALVQFDARVIFSLLDGSDGLSYGVPKRRQTPDRPRDVNQLAQRIVALSTGQEAESFPEAPPAAASKRGKARAAKLTPARRKQIARKAARTRWNGA